MSEQGNVKVARAFLQTFNAADWDSVKGSLAPNSVYDELGPSDELKEATPSLACIRRGRQPCPMFRATLRMS